MHLSKGGVGHLNSGAPPGVHTMNWITCCLDKGQMLRFFSSPFIISDTANSCDPELPVANMCSTLRPEKLWFRYD
ncbi:hypothetical protein C4D60_Mb01t12130 [Musa balbisiana]|uniref:Uncharacterized protein n=1 Tax=Musa balbisiana TaxID=52838 RepID=A0A4S8JMI0_MUSBA|nr:hypothetical protein C4D60_Mb01t12130 [Musa balbisiana]